MMAYTADMPVELEKRLAVVEAANRLAVERGNNLLADLILARAENERIRVGVVALCIHWGHDATCARSRSEGEQECDCMLADLRALLDKAAS